MHALTRYSFAATQDNLPASADQVTFMSLSYTNVTDAGLQELVGLTNIQALHLQDTRVTDEGLKHLAPLTKLTFLSLSGTKVSDEGVKEFKRQRPNCEVRLTP